MSGNETFSGASANYVGLVHHNYTEIWFSLQPWGPDHNYVHTTPKEFENRASFLQLGPPSTPIRHGKGAFLKRSSNPPALRFSVDRKHLENDEVTAITWFPSLPLPPASPPSSLPLPPSLPEFSSNTNPNSFGVVCTENIPCVSRVKPLFLNSFGVMWTLSKCF